MSATVEIALIEITDRQRKEITPKELLELKRSILEKGLLHAIVLSYPGPGYRLLAGERRLRAMTELHEEGHTFKYNGGDVPAGQVPFTTVSDLTEVELMELELEENILRQPLTWMEEAEAKVKIHKLRQGSNPSQTILATATEISERSGTPVSTERQELARSLLIVKHKDDPRVTGAKNEREAYRALLDKAETEFKAKLAVQAKAFTSTHTLLKGDCRKVLPTLKSGTFDLILSDPPYGISADSSKKDSKHFYDDSTENALDVCKFIISEGFRLTKPKALLYLFCDTDNFLLLRTYAQQQGWSTWRTPLIWNKGHIGYAPWGRAGYTRTYEAILFASKGQRELYRPGGSDVLDFSRVTKKEKVHAAEKPPHLLFSLLSSACITGDQVLDPCCGSGPIFTAGEKMKVKVTGIELDDTYHSQALARIGDLYNGSSEDECDEELEEEAEGQGDEEVDLLA